MFFLGDIAFMLELFGFCIALMFLHHAKKEGSGLARAAGVILLIGSVILALCTTMGVSARRAYFEKEF
ncbi:MAG: hypothetical protein JSR46_09625, partial [Verrucomicrobia bacterium]|nr:hypothetical protein [Verrucomicrobiota bacterium]